MTVLNNLYMRITNKLYTMRKNLLPVHMVWILFAGICCNLLYQLWHSPVYFRDTTVYLQMVQGFAIGNWSKAFPLTLPILYPTLAGIIVVLAKIPVMPALLLVSGIFYSLTLFPIYSILKRIFSEKQAVIGVLLFYLNYKIADCSCAPLVDSGRIFFIFSSIALIWQTGGNVYLRLILLGVCYAGLALVRGEGVILAGILIAAHFIWNLRNHKMKIGVSAFCALLPCGIMVLFCLPRLLQFYHETGVPALEIRQVNAISQYCSYFFPTLSFEMSKYTFAGGNDMNMSLSGFFCNMRFYKNFLDGFFLPYLPFTLAGCAVMYYKKNGTPQHFFLLFILIGYNLFHFLIGASAGRYFLINSCLMLPFTVTGIIFVYEHCHKFSVPMTKFLILLAFVASLILIYKSFNIGRKFKTENYLTLANIIQDKFPNRVNLLLIGEDRGVGYYLNANVCNYRNYPYGLAERISLDDIFKHGINADEIDFAHTKLKSPVFFDVVLIDSDQIESYSKKYSHIFSENNILFQGREQTLFSISTDASSPKDN